jgi:S1-C subfamily serine protease
MRVGDLITAIDGKEIRSVDDLHRFLSEWPVGKRVALKVIRGEEHIEINVLPTEAPSSD